MYYSQINGFIAIFTIFAENILATQHEKNIISPPTPEIVHYVNDSHIVQCTGYQKDEKIRWVSPKGNFVMEEKGRVHVEEISSGQLALVFKHITVSDKGNWVCLGEDGETKKSFQMIVNQRISFMDTQTLQTAEEDKDATIRCEVKGDPEPTVSWLFNGEGIALPHTKFRKLADGLLIKRVSKSDSGEYTCRAFQVSDTISNVEEQTIRLNIQHKPIATEQKASADIQYGYVNGVANLTCKALAEPQAAFTWYRNGKKINSKVYPIYTWNHTSVLEVFINDSHSFADYKCVATNKMGSFNRTISLQEGTKPPTPSQFHLRGVNSDTFDIDVGAIRTSNIRSDMDINGYRFEVIPETEFLNHDKKWINAKIWNFGFEDGVTFLIKNLAPDTAYRVRVASKNSAGLSDWTEPKIFRTYQKEPIMYPSSGTRVYSNLYSIVSIIFYFFRNSIIFCEI